MTGIPGEIMAWAVDNPLSAVTALVTAASILARFTPSRSDNKVADALLEFLHHISLNVRSDRARPAVSHSCERPPDCCYRPVRPSDKMFGQAGETKD